MEGKVALQPYQRRVLPPSRVQNKTFRALSETEESESDDVPQRKQIISESDGEESDIQEIKDTSNSSKNTHDRRPYATTGPSVKFVKQNSTRAYLGASLRCCPGPIEWRGKCCAGKQGPTGACGATGAPGKDAEIWKLVLNENGSSLDRFSQESGDWQAAEGSISTIATSGGSFLRYDTQTAQQQQIFECFLRVPSPVAQNTLENQIGIILGWSGTSNATSASVCYIKFDTDADGVPTNSGVFLDRFNNGTAALNGIPFALDTSYRMRVIRVGGNMRVYIDGNFILQGNFGGAVDTGDYIGVWALAESGFTAQFTNMKSWSILEPDVV